MIVLCTDWSGTCKITSLVVDVHEGNEGAYPQH